MNKSRLYALRVVEPEVIYSERMEGIIAQAEEAKPGKGEELRAICLQRHYEASELFWAEIPPGSSAGMNVTLLTHPSSEGIFILGVGMETLDANDKDRPRTIHIMTLQEGIAVDPNIGLELIAKVTRMVNVGHAANVMNPFTIPAHKAGKLQ